MSAVRVAETSWMLGPEDGELLILTGVAGPAAKMGHRLTIAMKSWKATVQWQGDEPIAAELLVDVDSLEVLNGQGGVTPLSGAEKSVVRSNALKSLNAKKHPQIRFSTEGITKTGVGFRLEGTVEIHGKSRTQAVDLVIEDRGASWAMSVTAPVLQTDFGLKPFSLLMGSMKVADEVSVQFNAERPK